MERGRDENKQKELIFEIEEGGELRASSTINMTEQVGGGIRECQARPDDEETQKSIPVCEDSVKELMSINLTPDDVASTMGQIHFWKARSTIVNQQRLFVAQVFELRRLIKVQQLIAESPEIMFDEGAYLGNTLQASATKRARVNHDIEPIPNIDMHGVDEKGDRRSEKAVEKTPISSSQIDNQLSN